jgi:tyrosyl-tRNA synthetase
VQANSFIGKAIIYENSRMQRTHLKKDGVVGITFSTFLWTLKHITHSRIITRDMFQERIKKGEEIYLPELLYPVLQGMDSFVLAQIYGSCDLEIGGTDQTFNMLLGRDVMKANSIEPQSVASIRILKGLDGKEKMSKSLNNYIAINDVPSEMFGKIMSIPDDLMQEYFELCTDLGDEEIKTLLSKVENGENPKNIKTILAKEIVKMYHGESAAVSAAATFESTFSRGEFPMDAETINCSKEAKLADILVDKKIVPSKTEFRRLVESGAVSDYPDQKINDPNEVVGEGERKIKIGKKIFIVLKPE